MDVKKALSKSEMAAGGPGGGSGGGGRRGGPRGSGGGWGGRQNQDWNNSGQKLFEASVIIGNSELSYRILI